MINQVIVRINMNRSPMLEDVRKKVGLEELAKRLAEEGWISSEGKMLKGFDYFACFYDKNANSYVEWRAISRG